MQTLVIIIQTTPVEYQSAGRMGCIAFCRSILARRVPYPKILAIQIALSAIVYWRVTASMSMFDAQAFWG